MNLDTIMSREVVTVGPDDRLERVKEIFDNASFHHLLVVEAGMLVGVISDRDLLKAISPNIDTVRCTWRDLDTLKKPAHAVMTRKPVTLTADATVNDAVGVFVKHRISCIPVVDQEGGVVGIVTWRDIMKHFPAILAAERASVMSVPGLLNFST